MKKTRILFILWGTLHLTNTKIVPKEITQTVLVWDSDGTVVGPKNPHDQNDHTKIILPGIETAMHQAHFNCMISGTKTPTSQDYNPEVLIPGFKDIMEKLPVSAIAFSATKEGLDCYVLVKKPNTPLEIRKIHEDPRYQKYRGTFKKPDVGMFIVLRDIAQEFGYPLNATTSLMIGDTKYDEEGAKNFGISFLYAQEIHTSVTQNNN